jgi:hypothetical protein
MIDSENWAKESGNATPESYGCMIGLAPAIPLRRIPLTHGPREKTFPKEIGFLMGINAITGYLMTGIYRRKKAGEGVSIQNTVRDR